MRERIDRCGDAAMERVMLIILCLYAVALWAIFSRFKLVRWGWASGSVAVLVGLLILATFLALFNYLTPSGRLIVTGRVGSDHGHSGQTQRTGENRRRAVSDRSSAIPVQGFATEGVAGGPTPAGRTLEGDLYDGDRDW